MDTIATEPRWELVVGGNTGSSHLGVIARSVILKQNY